MPSKACGTEKEAPCELVLKTVHAISQLYEVVRIMVETWWVD